MKVFNRKIRDEIISNTWWILFFACSFVRCALPIFYSSLLYCDLSLSLSLSRTSRTAFETLRLGLHESMSHVDIDEEAMSWVTLWTLVFVDLFLGLALNHQRKYRGSRTSSPFFFSITPFLVYCLLFSLFFLLSCRDHRSVYAFQFLSAPLVRASRPLLAARDTRSEVL